MHAIQTWFRWTASPFGSSILFPARERKQPDSLRPSYWAKYLFWIVFHWSWKHPHLKTYKSFVFSEGRAANCLNSAASQHGIATWIQSSQWQTPWTIKTSQFLKKLGCSFVARAFPSGSVGLHMALNLSDHTSLLLDIFPISQNELLWYSLALHKGISHLLCFIWLDHFLPPNTQGTNLPSTSWDHADASN